MQLQIGKLTQRRNNKSYLHHHFITQFVPVVGERRTGSARKPLPPGGETIQLLEPNVTLQKKRDEAARTRTPQGRETPLIESHKIKLRS
jgi:hypothetical protein